MEEVGMLGLDIAKTTFQAHGATADGGVVFRKKRARGKGLEFLSQQPACIVALEALRFCASLGGARSQLRVMMSASSRRSMSNLS